MPTPWLEFSNLRILWQQPTSGVVDLRNGPNVTTRDVVIEAAVKVGAEFQAPKFSSAGVKPTDGTATAPLTQPYKGYLTRWAVVPDGATWLDIGTAWEWTDTGRRPARFRASQLDYKAFLGPIGSLPDVSDGQMLSITFASVGSSYGTGAIGALLLAEQGEELIGTLRVLS